MIGIRIDFLGAKASLNFSTPVEGFRATAQNACVGFITERSSLDLFPARGTRLFSNAVAGAIVDGASAKHACAFAANDALSFARETEDQDAAESLADLTAVPTGVEAGRLQVRLSMRSTGGDEFNTLV